MLKNSNGFNIINGAKVCAQSGESIDVFCPSDGLPFAKIARSSAADVELAVQSAYSAFHSDAWQKASHLERGRLLTRLMKLIERDRDELAALESRDTGKPLKQGIADVTAAIRYLEFYGSAADKLQGDTIPFLDGYTALTLREPHGVVAGIIPWNYPLQILSRKMASAIAMGNTFVAKPAEDASLTSLRMAELAMEAGFPAGLFNVVTGYGPEAGAALAAHPLVDFVTFTGSTTTGTLIQQAAAQNNRGTTMELGGKSAQIIFADADLEIAAPVIVNAIIQNGGQTCSAGARVLIERPVYEKLAAMLADRFSKLTAAPHDADADLGPMINAKQAAKIEAYIVEAQAEGIECLARGKVASDVPKGGAYVAPALFGNVPWDSKLAQEEVFGPVLVLMPFEDEADAIRLANSTPFGLVAGVWTKDGSRQHHLAKRIRAGQVYVNSYGAGGGVELPFGGFGKSGHGREKGMAGLLDMSAVKTIVFKHG
ncbi:MAG: aldehyde dehydrogenase family protein [Notoacmeibacter sp.]